MRLPGEARRPHTLIVRTNINLTPPCLVLRIVRITVKWTCPKRPKVNIVTTNLNNTGRTRNKLKDSKCSSKKTMIRRELSNYRMPHSKTVNNSLSLDNKKLCFNKNKCKFFSRWKIRRSLPTNKVSPLARSLHLSLPTNNIQTKPTLHSLLPISITTTCLPSKAVRARQWVIWWMSSSRTSLTKLKEWANRKIWAMPWTFLCKWGMAIRNRSVSREKSSSEEAIAF